jgi:hypothetical protein
MRSMGGGVDGKRRASQLSMKLSSLLKVSPGPSSGTSFNGDDGSRLVL